MSCGCSAPPIWNDTLYGGSDARIATTEWRRLELVAETKRYMISGTHEGTVAKPITLRITDDRTASLCDADFFGVLTGEQSIQNVDFEPAGSCVYEATFLVHTEGSYALHVWLTYINGSSWVQPAAMMKHLLAPYYADQKSRRLLFPSSGRLKGLPVSVTIEQLLNRSSATRSFMYSFAGTKLEGTPWKLHIRNPPNTAHPYRLEPLCDGSYRGAGVWLARDACLREPSCKAQGEVAFYSPWVWKPLTCRLRYFHTFAAFELALEGAARRHGVYNETKTLGRLHVLMAGESLMREDFCALLHFASGRPWEQLNCAQQLPVTFITGQYLTCVLASGCERGFYETAYGYQVRPHHTYRLTESVIQQARLADHILWSDVGHSLEKNDDKTFVALVLHVTSRLTRAPQNATVSWRPSTYIHSLGPAGVHSGGFYRWSYFLPGPRVLRLNRQLTTELSKRGHLVQFAPTHMHRSRPDLTRDRMHSSRAVGYGNITPQQPCCLLENSMSVNETCQRYCQGKWAAFKSFTELERPILQYYTMQLTLNWLLQLTRRSALQDNREHV